jgi:hypothetical protein
MAAELRQAQQRLDGRSSRAQRKITREFPAQSRASSKIGVQKLKDPHRIFDFTLHT